MVNTNFTNHNTQVAFVKSKKNCKMSAPCILPNIDDVSSLRVSSERYYPVTINLQKTPSIRKLNGNSTTSSSMSYEDYRQHIHTALYVKKKAGHLSYVHDPHALRSLTIQAAGGSGGGSSYSTVDLIKSFTEDPRIVAFARFFCEGDHGNDIANEGNKKSSEQVIERFCTEILYECLTEGKPEALLLYLSLHSRLAPLQQHQKNRHISSSMLGTLDMWDLRLIKSYYESSRRHKELMMNSSGTSLQSSYSSPNLLSKRFVTLMCEHIDRFFACNGFTGDVILQYYTSGVDKHGHNAFSSCIHSVAKPLIGAFLVWRDVPSPFQDGGKRFVVSQSSLCAEMENKQ